MEKKYRLLENDTITVGFKTLYRIEALKDFAGVKKGDKGGYVEKEENLSHEDNCWVYDNALVHGEARISGNVCVSDNACVSGNAKICGNMRIYEGDVV